MNSKQKVAFALVLLAVLVDVKGQMLSGDLTYYYEWKGNYGSCGLDRSRYDQFYVAALARTYMNMPAGMTNPNNHPLCGAEHCIQVYGSRGSVVLKVSDTCEGCKGNDVDVADTVFPMLEDPNRGRVPITWKWVDCRSNPPGRR